MSLRPYQSELLNATRQSLRSHRSVLMVLPCGGGKTVLASTMMKNVAARGGRAWFICGRDYLLDQTSGTLDRDGIDHRFIAAGRQYNPWHQTQIAAIDTLKNRITKMDPACLPSVVIWDEAHHIAAASYVKVKALCSGARHIGLTATPERLDGKPLGEHFETLVQGPTVASLIQQGYLSRYRAFAPSTPDLTGVATRAGDYATDQLESVMDKSILVGDMVGHYKRHALGKRAVYFCVSIHHSQHVAAALRAAGVSAVHMDGTNSSAERRSAAAAMARGEIDVIVCVNLFGEGADLAAMAGQDVSFEVVGLARPTQSYTLWMQQIMRAMRPKPEPAIILDHAGSLLRHGLPDDDREWTLDGRKRTKADANAVPSVKTCASCFAAFRASLRQCPVCGVATEIQAREVEHIDGELSEIDPEAMRAARLREQGMAKSVEELIRVGRAQGMKHPERWAAHVATARAAKAQRKAEAQYAAYAR